MSGIRGGGSGTAPPHLEHIPAPLTAARKHQRASNHRPRANAPPKNHRAIRTAGGSISCDPWRGCRRRRGQRFRSQTILFLWSAASIFARSDIESPTAFVAAPLFAARRNYHLAGTSAKRASLASVSVHHPLPVVRGNVKSFFKEPAHHDDESRRPLEFRSIELQHKLISFSSNIGRLRAARKKGLSGEDMKANGDALIGACTSFVHFLRDETEKLSPSSSSSLLSSSAPSVTISWDLGSLDNATIETLRETLETVLIQSIRGLSEVGNFALLFKLVYAAVGYAVAVSASGTATTNAPTRSGDGDYDNDNGHADRPTHGNYRVVAVLSPRVFGEAVSSLAATKASVSKIKSLWHYFICDVAQSGVLSSLPAAYELNTILSALSDRGKVAAALKLHRQAAITAAGNSDGDAFRVPIEGDPYTASILFGMLANTISIGDGRNSVWMLRNGEQEDDAEATDLGEGMSYASPCWQWNEATAILEMFSPHQLNNHAYSELLKVNERATQVYNSGAGLRHNGAKCAISVLERMKRDEISPDVVTCSVLMSTFAKGRHWKAAVALMNAMRASSPSLEMPSQGAPEKKWSLPLPNAYTYSLVISTCARCNQGGVALSILDQIEKDDRVDSVRLNTWVYNAGILACIESSKKFKKGEHLAMAFDILARMEYSTEGPAPPDTVSYNTVLSAINEGSFAALKEWESISEKKHGKSSRLLKHDRIVDVVMDILESMEATGVRRDAITYYNAIMTCRSSLMDAFGLYCRFLSDTDSLIAPENEVGGTSSTSQLKGRAASDMIFVANAALSVTVATGDIHVFSVILSSLSESKTKLNTESIKHIVRILGQINDCEAVLALMICLRGQRFANKILKDRYSIDILSNVSVDSIPMIEESVYSVAIVECLRHDELGMADQILMAMKKNRLMLHQCSLKGIIGEYCRMAMASSKEEFKLARLGKKLSREADGLPFGMVQPIYITSQARARAALTMLKSVEKAVSPNVLSPVAKACCAAGLWQDARSVLRQMHRAAIHELYQGGGIDVAFFGIARGNFLNKLPRLHRSLLKFCAKGGNITPALNFADDIQLLASQIRQHNKSLRGSVVSFEEKEQPELVTLSSSLLMDIPTPQTALEANSSYVGTQSTMLDCPVGLTGQDWKLILIAASRGGHWKVCVGTLPFIRPYVRETHPMYARESVPGLHGGGLDGGTSTSRFSLSQLNRKYERIARALTAAVLCFEARSQYAWAMRAIDDWIEWSGRRPRTEAVASACRALAKKYLGQEILSLVTRVTSIPLVGSSEYDGLGGGDSEYAYEKAIYTEAANALHKSGLYEEADWLYAEGVAHRYLPWAVIRQDTDRKRIVLDLHGMSAAVAHSAVRVSLQKEIIAASQPPLSLSLPNGDMLAIDVLIITGRGRRSGERFCPVLRPEVQRMLTEEFYPPLGTSSVPGNMGALLIPGDDIKAWLQHHQQQKGQRMLLMAEILRDISSGNRLEKALMLSGNQLERALRKNFRVENTLSVVDDDVKQ